MHSWKYLYCQKAKISFHRQNHESGIEYLVFELVFQQMTLTDITCLVFAKTCKEKEQRVVEELYAIEKQK